MDVGHEGRALLVARSDELDGGIGQGVENGHVLFARQAEHALDLFLFQAFDQSLGRSDGCAHALRHPTLDPGHGRGQPRARSIRKSATSSISSWLRVMLAETTASPSMIRVGTPSTPYS